MKFGQILVIDNDETAQFILQRIMHRMKRTENLHFAKDGQEALKMMEELDFNLVLLDLHDPSVNGFRFLDDLEQRQATIGKPFPRVIVLSSFGFGKTNSRAKAGYSHLVSAYLEKPFEEKYIPQLFGVEAELK